MSQGVSAQDLIEAIDQEELHSLTISQLIKQLEVEAIEDGRKFSLGSKRWILGEFLGYGVFPDFTVKQAIEKIKGVI